MHLTHAPVDSHRSARAEVDGPARGRLRRRVVVEIHGIVDIQSAARSNMDGAACIRRVADELGPSVCGVGGGQKKTDR